MRKIAYFIVVVLAAVTFAIAACSSPAAKSPSPSSTTSKATSSTSTPAPATSTKPASPTATSSTPSASPSPSRQEQLETAAKKEGSVVFWSSFAVGAEKYLEPFQKRYPWLKVEVWQSDQGPLIEKILAEAKVGKFSVDVIGVTEDVAVLLPPDLYAKYDWPNAAKWPAETRPQNGLWLRTHVSGQGPVYNTKAVPAGEVPKTWEDMANAKWKDRTVLTVESREAPLVLAAMWGEKEGKLEWDRAFNFWQDLYKNTRPKTSTGYTTPTKLLAAGEYDLFPYGSMNALARLKATEGLPLGFIQDRYPAKPAALGIAKNAPNPNAARLFADYMSSAQGATLFADTFFTLSLSPDAGNAGAGNILKGIRLYLVPTDVLSDANLKKSSDFWAKLLSGK